MIGSLIHLCLSGLTRNGVHALLTIFSASIMPNSLDVIANFSTQVLKQLTALLATGVVR